MVSFLKIVWFYAVLFVSETLDAFILLVEFLDFKVVFCDWVRLDVSFNVEFYWDMFEFVVLVEPVLFIVVVFYFLVKFYVLLVFYDEFVVFDSLDVVIFAWLFYVVFNSSNFLLLFIGSLICTIPCCF